jgi:hypothetical protein
VWLKKLDNGMYTIDMFVRPKFFNHTRLTTFLKDDGKTELAAKIEGYQASIINPAYDVLAGQILEVVFDRLDNSRASFYSLFGLLAICL